MPKYLRKTHADGGTSLWPYTEVLATQKGMVPVPDTEDSQLVEKPATPEPEAAQPEKQPPPDDGDDLFVPLKRGPGRPRKNVL